MNTSRQNSKVHGARPSLTWKGKLLLLGSSIVFACVLMEIGLRVAAVIEARQARPDLNAPAGSGFWAIYDADLGYRGNPRYGDMNSHGLRSPEIGPKSETLRFLLLGDSVLVYGDTIDDTIAGHMRAAFAQDAGAPPVEIINAGVKGYTNYQELLYLKKYGMAFEPDVIGVQFCLNDLHQFLHSFDVQDGQIVPGTYQFSTYALGASKNWAARLAGQSYLMLWLNSKLHAAGNLIRWKWNGGFSFEYKVDVGTAWQEAPWQDIERQLLEMKQVAAGRGAPLFIAVFPLGWQYDAKYLQQDRERVLLPQRRLKGICGKLQIPFYDLYPDLDGSMFVEDSIHLTKPGRERAAKALKAFMMNAGVLPPKPAYQKK